MLAAILPRECEWCQANKFSTFFCVAGESRSQARRVETYSVSPPCAGMTRPDSTEASAGRTFEGRVGVPELIGFVAQRKTIVGRDDLAVLADGRKDHEVGARPFRRRGVYFQRPEPARKRDLCLVGHLLIAQHNDGVALECRARGS